MRMILLLCGFVLLGACTPHPKEQWLMPTPRIYQEGGFNPFAKLPKSKQNTVMPVHYATNRNWQSSYFGSQVTPELTYGMTHVGLGGSDTRWSELEKASTEAERKQPLPLRLVDFMRGSHVHAKPAITPWLASVQKDTRSTSTRDVVIYVHGAKVEFFHSCAFAAELGHFSGRDLTPIAFDWPTHPEIFSYLTRIDISHGIHSAERLAELVRNIATHTDVRRIHLVSWSAGARVLSRAMVSLAGENLKNNGEALRKRYRIGTTVFAASDVPEKDFITRLPAIHSLSERIIVYLSDNDGALKWSARLMGGGRRLGLEPKALDEHEALMLHAHPKLQVVDCSWGKNLRGFDISGHRYWYQHPWVSSDLFLALTTDATPQQRGLRPASASQIFYFAPEYGEQIGKIAKKVSRPHH
jgi:esterase/lipase superfamily enzyme